MNTHCFLVLLVYLDGLISLSSKQAATTVVKRHGKDTGLTVQRTRLGLSLSTLEVEACSPVPEM